MLKACCEPLSDWSSDKLCWSHLKALLMVFSEAESIFIYFIIIFLKSQLE